MKRYLVFFVLLAWGGIPGFAQQFLPKKGQFFCYWGYNRAWYAPSDIHVYGPGYDFTAYQLKAKDRPSPISLDYINPTKISIPQYNFRFGYHLTDRWVLSVGSDHMKYVVVQDQTAAISGIITPEFSDKYQGVYLNQEKVITRDFLRYEHTNGYNHASIEIEYLQPLFHFAKGKAQVSWNIGTGGFFLIPKSDIQVAGYGADNRFHLAGYALTAKTGPRLDYGRFFLSTEIKPGYSTMPDILINNDAPDRATQDIAFVQWYAVLGFKFNTRKAQDSHLKPTPAF